MTDLEALKAQISDEADLCRNEGATDIASLLDDTRYTIETQAREIERLRGALKEIMDLPGEINPSNYDHVDVCELNRQFCLTYEIARAALGDSHDQ